MSKKSEIRQKKAAQLRTRNRDLQQKLEEAQDTLRAIAHGEVDAFIVDGDDGQHVYTLKSAEHPYRVMVEAMNEGAATLLPDGTIIYCNSQLAEILKRTCSDLTGRPMAKFIALKDQPKFAVMLNQVPDGKTKAELFLTLQDGSLVSTQVSLASVNLDGASAVSMIVTDLTEQKQNEALIVSEKLTRSILEQAAEAIIVCDETGLVLRANPAAQDLIGRSPVGIPFPAAFPLVGEDFKRLSFVTSEIKKAPMRGRAVSLVRPDGHAFLLSMSISHLKNSDVGFGYVVTLTDITERKRIESELKAAKVSAEAASELKTAFLANMSHEIRTPLGAIIGFTELLKDEELSDKDKQNYLEVISRSGKSLTRLIDDILDLSKVEAGQLKVEKVSISLKELLNEVCAMFHEKAHKKNLHLLLKPSEALPDRIKVDPTRLRQILVNVIGNAVKFTDQGEVQILASAVAVSGESIRLQFRVEDSGVGLTEEQASRLFQPFSQADSSTTRKFGGTGLGLVLSRRLARAMGGEVKLVSTSFGHGSTFEITVLADIEKPEVAGAHDAASIESRIPQTIGANALAELNILVVEDSEDNQELIRRFLTAKGAKVELASNGAEGVQRALQGMHDLILMDIQMPVLDGYSATAQLRKAGYTKPIIAVTAYAMEEEKARCIERGCNGHLSKPLNSTLLSEMILASIVKKDRRPASEFSSAKAR